MHTLVRNSFKEHPKRKHTFTSVFLLNGNRTKCLIVYNLYTNCMLVTTKSQVLLFLLFQSMYFLLII